LSWYEFKEPIVSYLGISRDGLHVFLGFLAFAAIMLLLRAKPGAVLAAWVAVFAAEILNEIGDSIDWYHWTGGINWHESEKDIVLSMSLPTGILFSVLYVGYSRRKLLTKSGRQGGTPLP
jgi:hypothetical protein